MPLYQKTAKWKWLFQILKTRLQFHFIWGAFTWHWRKGNGKQNPILMLPRWRSILSWTKETILWRVYRNQTNCWKIYRERCWKLMTPNWLRWRWWDFHQPLHIHKISVCIFIGFEFLFFFLPLSAERRKTEKHSFGANIGRLQDSIVGEFPNHCWIEVNKATQHNVQLIWPHFLHLIFGCSPFLLCICL